MKNAEPRAFLAHSRLRCDHLLVEMQRGAQLAGRLFRGVQELQFVHEIEAELFEAEVSQELMLARRQFASGSGFDKQRLENFLGRECVRRFTRGVKFLHVSFAGSFPRTPALPNRDSQPGSSSSNAYRSGSSPIASQNIRDSKTSRVRI